MIKLKIQETNVSFQVKKYQLYDYNYEIYIVKTNQTRESLKKIFKEDYPDFACELYDTTITNSEDWGELPLTWAAMYFSLDAIEELNDSFHLSFGSTAFKKRDIEKNTANIDYLAMMMDLELEQEEL